MLWLWFAFNRCLPFSDIPQHVVQFLLVCVVNGHDTLDMNGTYYFELNHQTLIRNHLFFFAFWPVDDLVDLFVYAGMSAIYKIKKINKKKTKPKTYDKLIFMANLPPPPPSMSSILY